MRAEAPGTIGKLTGRFAQVASSFPHGTPLPPFCRRRVRGTGKPEAQCHGRWSSLSGRPGTTVSTGRRRARWVSGLESAWMHGTLTCEVRHMAPGRPCTSKSPHAAASCRCRPRRKWNFLEAVRLRAHVACEAREDLCRPATTAETPVAVGVANNHGRLFYVTIALVRANWWPLLGSAGGSRAGLTFVRSFSSEFSCTNLICGTMKY